MRELVPNLNLADLDLFVRVAKLKSLRECARQLDLTPGAVSKSIKRLEEKLGQSLLRRSSSGIVLSSEGNHLVQVAEKILRLTDDLGDASERTAQETVWSVGSLSFLSSRLLPSLLNPISQARSRTRFRIVEFTNNQLVAHGLNGAFEMAVHIGPLEWTRVWSSYGLGQLRWALYARKGHPILQLKSVRTSDVVRYPFVTPVGWSAQGFTRGEDHCPIPWGVRHPGHEATTGETALEVVSATDQFVFVPAILGQRLIQAKLVEEIRVNEWPVVEKMIYLSVRDDLVSASLLKQVTGLLQAQLSGLHK